MQEQSLDGIAKSLLDAAIREPDEDKQRDLLRQAAQLAEVADAPRIAARAYLELAESVAPGPEADPSLLEEAFVLCNKAIEAQRKAMERDGDPPLSQDPIEVGLRMMREDGSGNPGEVTILVQRAIFGVLSGRRLEDLTQHEGIRLIVRETLESL